MIGYAIIIFSLRVTYCVRLEKMLIVNNCTKWFVMGIAGNQPGQQ